MKFSDLRLKDFKELNKLLAQERNDLRELRFKVASKQIKNYKEIQQRKNNIAQIKTVMKEKNSSTKESGVLKVKKDKV